VIKLVKLNFSIIKLKDLRAVKFIITIINAISIKEIIYKNIINIKISLYKALLAPFLLIEYRIIAIIVT
jgi:hypothetical protein